MFIVTDEERVEPKKLKIRIADEVLEFHILVEASKEILELLQKNEKTKELIKRTPTSTKRRRKTVSELPIQLFSCIACKVILFCGNEIDWILIEDRMCSNISIYLQRPVQHDSSCPI